MLRDTTLREGIQIPGSRVSLEQKQKFISLLAKAGVREIEIGLPDSVSACIETADMIQNQGYAIKTTAIVPCYTNRWRRQIDAAAEHGIDRIDILTPMSDLLFANPDHYGMRTEDILPRPHERGMGH